MIEETLFSYKLHIKVNLSHEDWLDIGVKVLVRFVFGFHV